MSWSGLSLWKDEENRIQACLTIALQELISHSVVKADDNEIEVSGKLRPLIRKQRKALNLGATVHFESSVFMTATASKPAGHPDIQFTYVDSSGEQWEYDVECKLVRVKRQGKDWDYCEHYVVDGVKRFASGKYCANGFSGTMIGYAQEGELPQLLRVVNQKVKATNYLPIIRRQNVWQPKGVTRLVHCFPRGGRMKFRLTHLWADIRNSS